MVLLENFVSDIQRIIITNRGRDMDISCKNTSTVPRVELCLFKDIKGPRERLY